MPSVREIPSLSQSPQRGGAATKRIGTQGNSQAGKQETQENRIIGKVQRSGPRPDPLFSPRTQRAQRSLRSAQNFLANLALFARGVLRIRVHGRFQTETSRMTLNTGRVNSKPKNELRRKTCIKKTKWTDSSTEERRGSSSPLGNWILNRGTSAR